MLRSNPPISFWLDQPDPAGGILNTAVHRLEGGADRTIPAGRRSISIAVLDGTPAPTVAGVALPEGAIASWVSDYPGNQLPQIPVLTAAGADVIITETYLGPDVIIGDFFGPDDSSWFGPGSDNYFGPSE